MAVFNYHAKDSQGLSLTGILEAQALDEAVSLLRKRDLIIVSLKETQPKTFQQKKIRLEDLAVFSRQLATLIEAGITIVHALQILKDQTKNKSLAVTIINVRDRILNGASLHEALAKHPKIFSPLYISLARTGEIAGVLNETLSRLATYLEKMISLERKVRSALVYPILVVSMAFLITSVLLIKVVPTFEYIFKTLGGALPLPTQILILISTVVRKYFIFGLILLFLTALGIKKYAATPNGRRKFDTFILAVPVFGDLIHKVIIARFARTLSTMVKSALPIIQGLAIVGKSAGNVLVEEALLNAAEAVKHGEPIAEPLSKSGVFPAMVVGMVSVGEQTGQLEKMLTKVADLYDEEVEATVSGLTSLIEPIVITFLGVVVGGIVISLFLPIFKVIELIH